MAITSAVLSDSRLANSQYECIELLFNVTGGAASLIAAQQAPLIVVDANGDSTQALVNTLLEVSSSTSTSELDYATACGATALGVDSFAIVVMCAGQIKRTIAAAANLYTTQALETGGQTDNTDVVTIPFLSPAFVEGTDGTVPPNTLTNYLYKTPAGNLYSRFVVKGFDAASSAYMHVKLWVVLK